MAHRITNPPRRPRITETTIEASCKQEDHFYTARRSRNQSSAELHSISIYRNPRSSRRFLERGIHSASTPDVPWLLTVPRRSRREAQIFRSAAVSGRRNFGRLWCSGLPAHRLPSRIAAPEDGRTPFGCGASRAAPYRQFAIGWPFGVTHRLTRP